MKLILFHTDYHAFREEQLADIDEDLTQIETLKLVMVEDRDVRITWEEVFKTRVQDAIHATREILFTAYFSGCRLASNEGCHVLCHRAALKGNNLSVS